jgi:electron transfer flavoprotein alpha subunit
MSHVLIIAEHANGRLNPSTARCVRCATQLDNATIDVLVLATASDAASVGSQAAALDGVSRVRVLANPANTQALAALQAPQVVAIAGSGYSHVFGPSTTFGKDLVPRVAALLGVGQLSDIMAVEAPNRFRRPLYAGDAIISVEPVGEQVIVATVRAASFQPVGNSGSADIVHDQHAGVLPTHTRFVSASGRSDDRPDLQTALRVVSGGRAVGSAEGFAAVHALAETLGAAVGASRAAVDAGYCPNDMQVGQTGKIIAPQLYVAIGISGAIQHLTGIKDAGTIVAINKDPDAPIFEMADFGLVGDLFTVVPELQQALQ